MNEKMKNDRIGRLDLPPDALEQLRELGHRIQEAANKQGISMHEIDVEIDDALVEIVTYCLDVTPSFVLCVMLLSFANTPTITPMHTEGNNIPMRYSWACNGSFTDGSNAYM